LFSFDYYLYQKKLKTLKKLIVAILILASTTTYAQIGGDHAYEFLTIPTSARVAALGGTAMAIDDGDITLSNQNPSLLANVASGKLALEYINYISDINFGHVSYAHKFEKIGTMSFGVQYLNGGNFIRADELGNQMGAFTTSEIALKAAYAKSFDSIFTIGATIKPVYSQLEQYRSLGLLMDVGASYTSKNKLFTSSLLFSNMGSQLTTYIDTYESVPFEIQLGISQKLEHAPFRFSIIARHLEQPLLSWTRTNYPEPSNVEQEYEDDNKKSFIDDVMRHMVFGAELNLGKNFFARAGYSYQRFVELKVGDRAGAAGFSWGFGFKIKRLHFSYANARYNYAGTSNHFTITTNIRDYLR
jgi:hypothetical protein